MFILPDNPGPSANVPAGQTSPQITELVREHEAQLKIWKQYNQVEQTLKQQLISVFDDIYLTSISNRHIGFTSLSLLNMLQFLYNIYRDITLSELEDNNDRIRLPYDPTQLIETLYNQIE